jgi:hypothetical protein
MPDAVPNIGIDPKGDLTDWAGWSMRAGWTVFDQLKGRASAIAIRDFAHVAALQMMNDHALIQGIKAGVRLFQRSPDLEAAISQLLEDYQAEYEWRRLWWIGQIRTAYVDYQIELRRQPIGRGNPPKHYRIMMMEEPRTKRDRAVLTRDRWELSLAVKAFEMRRSTGNFRGLNAIVEGARDAGNQWLDENSNERVKRMAKDLWRDAHIHFPGDLAAALEDAQQRCKNLPE